MRDRVSMGKLALGAVGLVVGAVAVLALREATLTTHDEHVGPRIELELHARQHKGETSQTLSEKVEAMVTMCRLEVTSDIVGPIEDLGDGNYRAVLEPAMDRSNRRQFRGCLEDWSIDHVLVDVKHLGEPDS